MSPKELLYLEDALGHAKFLVGQCQEAVGTLQDAALKKRAQQLLGTNKQLYNAFCQTV